MATSGFDDDRTSSFTNLVAGTKITHYTIISKIGAGGMGEVYLALDTKLDREVALKFLPPHMCRDSSCRERFEREARAAARLHHPYIIDIHETDEFKTRPFIIMESIEGKSLKSFIREGSMTLNQAIKIGLQICAGLNSAHKQGVIHRDIKPSNILLDSTGNVKILDFGLAYISGDEHITASDSTMGTVGYMSPEQTQGINTDERSDIFSLGVVLYEMITGKLPFGGQTSAAVLHSITHDVPEPLTRYKSGIPHGLQTIMSKLLEKDPTLRYQTAADLLADLKRISQSIGMSVGHDRRIVSRKRRLGWGLVGCIALIIVSLVVRSSLQISRQSHIAILPIKNLGSSQVSQAFCEGLLESIASNLTQLQQYGSSLLVIPTSEIYSSGITSVEGARKAFGATLVVTGSLQEVGGDSRLSLNLVDAVTGRQLQSTVIDNVSTHQLKFQDSVVLRLAEMLGVELSSEDSRHFTAGSTEDAEAYAAYTEGKGFLRRSLSVRNLDSAIILFSNALAHDPEYALAFAGLGESYWWKYELTKESRWTELAIYNGLKGIELDRTLAPVHISLGGIRAAMGRSNEAVENFRRA